jgi:hypothetical protein
MILVRKQHADRGVYRRGSLVASKAAIRNDAFSGASTGSRPRSIQVSAGGGQIARFRHGFAWRAPRFGPPLVHLVPPKGSSCSPPRQKRPE